MTVFFVKQKTASEMRISDWSSDLCSSDLALDVSSSRGATWLRPTARFLLHGRGSQRTYPDAIQTRSRIRTDETLLGCFEPLLPQGRDRSLREGFGLRTGDGAIQPGSGL